MEEGKSAAAPALAAPGGDSGSTDDAATASSSVEDPAMDVCLLLERVLLRVGCAENDDQFQSVISKFLAPVLMKLTCQRDGVRKKVMELLVHINRRLKSRPNIQLPVQALIAQYQDPSASFFVTNFTIIYLKMGIPRLEVARQVELFPSLIHCLDNKPVQHQDGLLRLMVTILPHIKFPTDPNKCKSMFPFTEKPHLAVIMLGFMLDVLLLPFNYAGAEDRENGVNPAPATNASTQASPSSTPAASNNQPAGAAANCNHSASTTNANQAQGVAAPASSADKPMPVMAPRGMSEYGYKRVTAENPLRAEELEQVKLGIIKFTCCGTFEEDSVVCHLIVGSADSRYMVANEAENFLRKIAPVVDWNKTTVVKALYDMFLGSMPPPPNLAILAGPSPQPTTPIRHEHRRLPAPPRIRLKLMPYLLKSTYSASVFPTNIHVMFECLFRTRNPNVRLRHLALQFVYHVIEYCPESKLEAAGPVILHALLKLAEEEKEDAKLRSGIYVAVGKLSRKVKKVFIEEPAYIDRIMNLLESENSEVQQSVHECLSYMSQAYVYHLWDIPGSDKHKKKVEQARQIVVNLLSKKEPRVRMMAIQYIASVFPPDSVERGYQLIMAAADADGNVATEAVAYLLGEKVVFAARTVPLQQSVDLGPEPRTTVATQTLFPKFRTMMAHLMLPASSTGSPSPRLRTMPFPSQLAAIEFLRACMGFEAGVSLVPVDTDGPVLRKYYIIIWKQDVAHRKLYALDTYGQILHEAIVTCAMSLADETPCLQKLLELAGTIPELILPHSVFLRDRDVYKNFLSNKKLPIRATAAEVLGLTVSYGMGDKAFVDFIQCLWQMLKDKDKGALEKKHGAILCFGFTLASRYTALRRRKNREIVVIPDEPTNKPKSGGVPNGDVPSSSSSSSTSSPSGQQTSSGGKGGGNRKKKKNSQQQQQPQQAQNAQKNSPPKTPPGDGLPDMSRANLLTSPIIRQFTEALASLLTDKQVMIMTGCCTALGEIGRTGPIALPYDEDAGKRGGSPKAVAGAVAVAGAEDDVAPKTQKAVIDKLMEIAGNTKLPMRTREKSTLCGGLLCVGDPNFPHARYIMEGILKLAPEVKDIELHLAMGEALACCALGPRSPLGRDPWTTSLDEYKFPPLPEKKDKKNAAPAEDDIEWLLEHLLLKSVDTTHPGTRQALCVFLVCLTQYCRAEKALQERLLKIQRAFLEFLTDSNEFVQDLASRGISLVYEGSGPEVKRQLVDNLMDAFIMGRKGKGTSDSKVFKDGLLGAAPGSGKLMTYRELCYLAAELEQPDLVYKFMNLASNQALWSQTPKIPALSYFVFYGKAEEELTPYKKALIPKLFRYRFDPTPHIQQVMTVIWKALVPDTRRAVQENFVKIVTELITGLGDGQWRVRESCCDAVSEVVSGGNHALLLRHVPLSEQQMAQLVKRTAAPEEAAKKTPEKEVTAVTAVAKNAAIGTTPEKPASPPAPIFATVWGSKPPEEFLPAEAVGNLWRALFRCVDDVKESVRKTAEGALKVFRKAIVAAASTPSLQAQRLLDLTVPVLVNSGLTSTVIEARQCSMSCIQELCGDEHSQALKSQVHALIPALLKFRGETEPELLNQLSVRMGGCSEPSLQETLDGMRVASLHTSPAMDAIKQLIFMVDENSLKSLAPALIELMKSNCGLVTKAGCAYVVTLLVYRHSNLLQAHSGKLLAALVGNLNDRNIIIRKNYANAIGHLMKVARPSAFSKLGEKLQTWYLDKDEDEASHLICGITVRAVYRNSPSVTSLHVCWSMPLAFFAMHGPKPKGMRPNEEVTGGAHETSISVWSEVWSEAATTGTSSGILGQLEGITKLIEIGLNSQSWLKKAQAGRVVESVAKKVGNNLTVASVAHFVQLMNSGIEGRLWNGKEALIAAVVALAESCSVAMLSGEEPMPARLEKAAEILVKEACKEELGLAYKNVVITAVGKFLEPMKLDRYDKMWALLSPIVSEPQAKSKLLSEDEDAPLSLVTSAGRQSENLTGAKAAEKVYEAAWLTLGRAWLAGPRDMDRLKALLGTLASRISSSTILVMAAMTSCLDMVVADALNPATNGVLAKPEEQKAALAAIVPLIAQSCRHVVIYKPNPNMRAQSMDIMTRVLNVLREARADEAWALVKEDVLEMRSSVLPDALPKVVEAAKLLDLALPGSIQTSDEAPDSSPADDAAAPPAPAIVPAPESAPTDAEPNSVGPPPAKTKKCVGQPQKRPLEENETTVTDGANSNSGGSNGDVPDGSPAKEEQ